MLSSFYGTVVSFGLCSNILSKIFKNAFVYKFMRVNIFQNHLLKFLSPMSNFDQIKKTLKESEPSKNINEKDDVVLFIDL